jgi:hypothetical protein
MRVQIATDVPFFNELRQAVGCCGIDLIGAIAQLRRDDWQVQPPVKLCFCRVWYPHALLVGQRRVRKPQSGRCRAFAQLRGVRSGPRVPDERRASILGGCEVERDRSPRRDDRDAVLGLVLR